MNLLISESPVAGTVERISYWIEMITGIPTFPIIKNNYSHNAFSLSLGSLSAISDWEASLGDLINKANCIFLHNVEDYYLINLVMSRKSRGCNVLYQVHSPPLEGPQFLYKVLDDFDFSQVLVIGQGHGRFIDDAIVVPNIVNEFTTPLTIQKKNSIFIPHMRTTSYRWSNKISKGCVDKLYESQGLFPETTILTIESQFGRKVVSYSETRLLMLQSLFLVDDIASGLIHQTAIEGLKSGCIVFSGADQYTLEEYQNTIESPKIPLLSVDSIEDVIRNLIMFDAKDNLSEKIKDINDFSSTYLDSERLAKIYVSKIEKFL